MNSFGHKIIAVVFVFLLLTSSVTTVAARPDPYSGAPRQPLLPQIDLPSPDIPFLHSAYGPEKGKKENDNPEKTTKRKGGKKQNGKERSKAKRDGGAGNQQHSSVANGRLKTESARPTPGKAERNDQARDGRAKRTNRGRGGSEADGHKKRNRAEKQRSKEKSAVADAKGSAGTKGREKAEKDKRTSKRGVQYYAHRTIAEWTERVRGMWPGQGGPTPSTLTNLTAENETSEQRINVTADIGPNASALAHRRAALELLASRTGESRSRKAQRQYQTLNGTLRYVLDADRITSASVFKADTRVVAPLHKRAPNVTAHLVTSDALLAQQAIMDAKRTRRILDARNVSYDGANVSAEIAAADAALERADRHRSTNAMGAIPKYRQAWVHAQRALDLMDWAVTPVVTIDTREDLPHDGTVEYQLNGTVFDVRTYETPTLTLEMNGTARTVPLTTSTTPASVGTFNTTVTLQDRVHEIGTRGTDPNRALVAHDEREAPGPATGRDRLRLDADGLPDTYERSVTGTHPLGTDSNSTSTARNESGNGVLDGAEDFDGDSVRNFQEYAYGLAPFEVDTDGDRLTDGFELGYAPLDPRADDSDDDGVTDRNEDGDEDGLSTLREQNASTSPTRNDTDLDGLDDGAELDEHGTDPIRSDTDGDGLSDAEEVELGTDPVHADTDDDGTADGNETFTTSAVNESIGISIDVTGKGDVAGGVTVTNASKASFAGTPVEAATVSEIVDIRAASEFESATLTLSYEEGKATSERDLAVYRFEPENQRFVKLDSTVDTGNDTVSAKTPHFSTYLVMDSAEWAEAFEEKLPTRDDARSTTFDEEFGDTDGWSCEGECTGGNGRVVIGGGSQSQSLSESSSIGILGAPRCDLLGDVFDCIDDSEDDPDDCAADEIFDKAYRECIPGDEPTTTEPPDDDGGDEPTTTTEPPDDDGGNEDNDGWHTPEPIPPSEFSRGITLHEDVIRAGAIFSLRGEATDKGVATVCIIGESETICPLSLENGETRTWTILKPSLTRFAGEEITLKIRTTEGSTIDIDSIGIWQTRDSDGDGLPNEMEKRGIRNFKGETVTTDPFDRDTDDDGWADGKEVGEFEPKYASGGYHYLVSDPSQADTDGDGVDDPTERRIFDSNPRDRDTDQDGYNDLIDRRPSVEDNQPTIEIRSDNLKESVDIIVSDESPIESVEVNGHYKPWCCHEPYWNESYPSRVVTLADGSSKYHVPIRQHGFDEHPEEYYVNATDAHGNKVVFRVSPVRNGGFTVASVAVVSGAAGSEVAAGGGAVLIGGSAVTTAGVAVLVVGGIAYLDYQTTSFESEQEEWRSSLPALTLAELVIENPRGVEKEVELPKRKWENHIEGRDRHLSKEEIRRVIEEADVVYRNEYGVYMWVIIENGVAKIVRAYDRGDKLEIGTAYERHENPREYVREWANNNEMYEIYSNER